eukprot:jgi/Undpi1/10042/HiC_scaffold_28.g12496.m1
MEMKEEMKAETGMETEAEMESEIDMETEVEMEVDVGMEMETEMIIGAESRNGSGDGNEHGYVSRDGTNRNGTSLGNGSKNERQWKQGGGSRRERIN